MHRLLDSPGSTTGSCLSIRGVRSLRRSVKYTGDQDRSSWTCVSLSYRDNLDCCLLLGQQKTQLPGDSTDHFRCALRSDRLSLHELCCDSSLGCTEACRSDTTFESDYWADSDHLVHWFADSFYRKKVFKVAFSAHPSACSASRRLMSSVELPYRRDAEHAEDAQRI